MSGPENFLSRWSRRKLEAERDAEPPAPNSDGDAVKEAAATADDRQPRSAQGATPVECPEELFDIAKLPSLESITAETDIRVFLQKGVPAELSRAALRRAWAADPAIRDFIGIAENQYDFATGSDLPGFGNLEIGADEIRRLVAEVFGEAPASPETPLQTAGLREAPAPGDENAGLGIQPTPTKSGVPPDRSPEEPAPGASSDAMTQRDKINVAMQHDRSEVNPELLLVRRSHGRALPQ